MQHHPAFFEEYNIRRLYDEDTETWFFSVVDVVRALLQQPDFQTTRKYWNKLKQRLQKEGNQSVTNCHRLKFVAADGKKYLSDAASAETLLRLMTAVRLSVMFYTLEQQTGKQVVTSSNYLPESSRKKLSQAV